MTAAETPRWVQRFESFGRAHDLLRGTAALMDERALSELERAGVIQQFEITWELGWKTLRDFLQFEGVALETATPRATIRAAFGTGIINDGETWMRALDARNSMSHTYNAKAFERIVNEIKHDYAGLFDDLRQSLDAKISGR